MKYILDIMKENIKKLDDSLQIKMIREVIEPSFKELIEHTEKMYSNLESKIYNDIILKDEDYEIFTTILNRSELSYHGNLFSPIISDEIFEINKKELLKKLKDENIEILGTIFIPLSIQDIEFLDFETRNFTAYLCFENEKCKISVTLKKSKRYLDKEVELYNLFNKNNLKWTSINNPYSRKMYDVVAINILGDIDVIDEIIDIEYDFEDIDYVRNMVPVWNIFEKNKTVARGVDPAGETINFIYNFSSDEIKSDDDALIPFIDKGEIKALSRDKNEYKIVCDTEGILEWNFFIFKKVKDFRTEDCNYPVFRNRIDSSFDRFKIQNNIIIRTKAEIMRIAELYGNKYNLKLIDMEISDYYERSNDTYDINPFVRDEIRIRELSKTIILKFHVNEEDYLTKDILSFIVAEIQNRIVDFNCIGILV